MPARIVKTPCTADELRGLIRQCEQLPEYGRRMIEHATGETLPDGWTPESAARELEAKGVYLVTFRMLEPDAASWWNVLLASYADLQVRNAIVSELRDLAKERGVSIESLIPLQHDLIEIRLSRKRRRPSEETIKAMLKAERLLLKGTELQAAVDFSEISIRTHQKIRERYPAYYELVQTVAKKERRER